MVRSLKMVVKTETCSSNFNVNFNVNFNFNVINI